MQLTVSYISPVSQQDIEVSIKQLDIYILFWCCTTPFSQISGGAASQVGLETTLARNFGTSGMEAFKEYGTIEMQNMVWNVFATSLRIGGTILHCYQAIGGSNKSGIRTLVGAYGLDSATVLGQYPFIFLPPEPDEFTFTGDGCHGSWRTVFDAFWIFKVFHALMYVRNNLRLFPCAWNRLHDWGHRVDYWPLAIR